MKIEYDEAKRAETLARRGVDIAAAAEVFATEIVTVDDDRLDYGESRFISVGFLSGRMVVVVWTWRGPSRRIISLRKANARERNDYRPSV